ncbi:TPA: hypothetical protein DEB00_00760 [Candidatus Uhrbacteria bacterium]|nr:hypothetical protein [Candidatus Uhrbacteria bacterium]
MSPKLSILIVSWNVKEALQKNLERLFALREELPFEVFVIDNASSDGTTQMVREHFPEVHLVINDWNAGFAYACNQGMRYATGEVMLLLNPDMFVGTGALLRTYQELMDHKQVGVVGIKLRKGNTYVTSVRRDPTWKDQLAIVLKLSHLHIRLAVVDRYLRTDMEYGKTQDVEQVRGSYFAFRRDVMDVVGTFDERFFLWFEEVDYCKRVREAGYVVRFLADVSCEDLVGQSFRQVSVGRKQAILLRSMAQFFGKHGSWWQAALFWTLRPFAFFAGSLYDLFKMEPS